MSALSPVSNNGLHPGWKQMSIHLLFIPNKSRETAEYFKIHKMSVDTDIKQNIQTSNTNFREKKK